ncbi:hypothetical protein NP493_455g01008 [Ridgeia piscesae]|uniref:EGF-like domain-containing protein n=1 Tax=Ridgeia piscesae TaxID=27915 RepID=A0AAD9KZ09_RIDPI|nr:hypothetical protein NP493_455g01008 [Ridgeia piscesae]
MGDGRTCNDQNECVLGLQTCDVYGDCVNSPGSYQCQCYAGYVLTANQACTDEDECTTSHHLCDLNALCENVVGSYKCTCLAGYEGDGFSCSSSDPDLCGTARCDEAAKCTQTAEDVYECVCHSGYKGSGYLVNDVPGCTEIDPCAVNTCDRHATCRSVEGRAFCLCDTGYKGNGFACELVKPCDDMYACGIDAVCTNGPGDMYNCTCPAGYNIIAEYDCFDDNECESGATLCPANAFCVNTAGSYTCRCESGFEEDVNKTCTDIKECELNLDDCDSEDDRAVCVEEDGAYSCECRPPYLGDGHSCLHADDPGCSLTCHNDSYCVTSGVAGDDECTCQDGFLSTDAGCEGRMWSG